MLWLMPQPQHTFAIELVFGIGQALGELLPLHVLFILILVPEGGAYANMTTSVSMLLFLLFWCWPLLQAGSCAVHTKHSKVGVHAIPTC